jgi:biopolymer transport protein ExbD
LTLLIIFMVISGFAYSPHYHRMGVDLPTVNRAREKTAAKREDAIWIQVTRDGSVYFRYRWVSKHEIRRLILEAVEGGAERRIYMAVDARARYSDVENVLDQTQNTGTQDVTFFVDVASTKDIGVRR